MARDGRACQWVRADTGALCGLPATDVDHIIAGDDHSLANLQALCPYHHARKSAREGAQATNAKRQRERESRREQIGSARAALLRRKKETET